MKRESEYYPRFRDEGEGMVSWGGAHLIKYLDGKLLLKGGSKADRIAIREWIFMFLNDAVVRGVQTAEAEACNPATAPY